MRTADGMTARAGIIATILSILFSGCAQSGAGGPPADARGDGDRLGIARVERLLAEAANVHRTSGRKIPWDRARVVTTEGFGFPVCLAPLATDRAGARSIVFELMDSGNLSDDERAIAELRLKFLHDPEATVIVSHFRTVDGHAFCGVNVVHPFGHRIGGRAAEGGTDALTR